MEMLKYFLVLPSEHLCLEERRQIAEQLHELLRTTVDPVEVAKHLLEYHYR